MKQGIFFEALTAVVVASFTIAGAASSVARAVEVNATPQWAPAVEPKPLSENVHKALTWLIQAQHPGGGWGQGEESAHMGATLAQLKSVANVADTSTATLALIRAGSSPKQGAYAEAVRRGVEFVCAQVEQSDPSSLYVTDARGTRLQMKLGTYIDTFLAAMLMSEVKGQMPDESGNARVAAVMNKIMDKIERNQKSDGSWDNKGWAPALAQAMASKAINRAAQAGFDVSEDVRGGAENYARERFDQKAGRFSGGGSAGVELYGAAANLGAMQDSDNTNTALEQGIRDQMQSASSSAERDEAQKKLRRFAEAKRELDVARKAVVSRLADPKFMAGFGSNGGEEFLSHMNIGESLVVAGGSAWKKWDQSMTANLNRIQNPDGSWVGHHCITGRTFCTATALLVLTVDRAPVPLAAQIRHR